MVTICLDVVIVLNGSLRNVIGGTETPLNATIKLSSNYEAIAVVNKIYTASFALSLIRLLMCPVDLTLAYLVCMQFCCGAQKKARVSCSERPAIIITPLQQQHSQRQSFEAKNINQDNPIQNL